MMQERKHDMEYYFNQLDPIKFQRLINTILVARYGEDARLTPLRGQDGGRDGETAPGNPYFEFQISETISMHSGFAQPPRKGRHLFQVKHHRTSDRPSSEARNAVISDFKRELKYNVLKREADERVNYFFLITNVPSSKDAITKIDKIRLDSLRDVKNIHADVWWQEQVVAFLDHMPQVWSSFSEMFAGGQAPFIANIADQKSDGFQRAIRIAINHQYDQDKIVKFRQIELEKNLTRLFVDLDISIKGLPEETQQKLLIARSQRHTQCDYDMTGGLEISMKHKLWNNTRHRSLISALGVLLDECKETVIRKLIIEGGPGQGKSTITQMAVQIYRQQILGKDYIDPENRWLPPQKARLPFRVELRRLAEWLNSNPGSSVEEYLTTTIKQDSGGNEITVNDLHTVIENSPVLVIFDGLDEIGSDKLRDYVLKAIMECISRFEKDLNTDLRVIITTRPPALAGRAETLIDFERLSLAPMENQRIEEYITRWLSVQNLESGEKVRIRESFERRQGEPHVEALARNPMQLSVLLQFIKLKGDAFPDRRAELYRDYFQIVIDRDVEKSPELRKNREIIQALHEYIGYKIHALTEVNQADRTLERRRLLDLTKEWLKLQGHASEMAQQFFKLGEERFGLIVASKGEGEETRYGYAIQPIQEYFAAAFISNQISPDSAHAIFEAMIHRQYWREVALFLAGLRRPNEKADLIARARSVDQDGQLGWYQDGRAIILQLLQEGVFSDPRYVFSLALDFIFELLDIKRLRVQREPHNLLSALGTLLSQPAIEQQKEFILRLLQDYKTCEDHYVLKRMYYVASQLLKPDDFLKTVMSYEGNNPEIIALIRLGWPCRWDIDIETLSQNTSFWLGVSDCVWAQTWWLESIRQGVVHDIQVPAHFNQRLIELFATNPIGGFIYYGNLRKAFIEVGSKLAVWKMVRNQQFLQLIEIYKHLGDTTYIEKIREAVALACKDDLDTDYTGLDEPFQVMTKEAIQLSSAILMSYFGVDEKEKYCALEEYVQRIRDYLQCTGLTSWVACKYAVNIIQGITIGELEPSHSRRFRSILDKKYVLSLVEDMRPFYEVSTAGDSHSSKSELESLNFLMNTFTSNPRCVRLEEGRKPVALVEILAESIRRGNDLPSEWMKMMLFPTDIIHPLFEKCKDCLPKLLDVIGKYRFGREPRKVLHIQDTQRILKVARRTDDPKTLAGVASVLVYASFLRIAETEVILKLLRVDSKILLATALFEKDRTLYEGRDPASITKEKGLIEKVARCVLEKPELYPFHTICLSSDFLANHSRIELPPLLGEGERLGIRLHSDPYPKKWTPS